MAGMGVSVYERFKIILWKNMYYYCKFQPLLTPCVLILLTMVIFYVKHFLWAALDFTDTLDTLYIDPWQLSIDELDYDTLVANISGGFELDEKTKQFLESRQEQQFEGFLYMPKSDKCLQDTMKRFQELCVSPKKNSTEKPMVQGFNNEKEIMKFQKTIAKINPSGERVPPFMIFKFDSVKNHNLSYTMLTSTSGLYVDSKYPYFKYLQCGCRIMPMPLTSSGIKKDILKYKLCLDSVFKTNEKFPLGFRSKTMPLPSFKAIGCGHFSGWTDMLILVGSVPLIFLASVLFEEKRTGVETILKMMGINFWIRYLTWFIWLLPFGAVFIICIYIYLGLANTTLTNLGLLFFYLLLFTICTLTFTMLVYICSNSFRHMVLGVFIWIIPFFANHYWLDWRGPRTHWRQFCMFFLYLTPTGPLVQAHSIMKAHDIFGSSLSFHNTDRKILRHANYPLFWTYFVHLILVTVLYVFLAWLVNIMLENDKIREFFKCRWRNLRKSKTLTHNMVTPGGFEPLEEGKYIEKPPMGANIVIQLRQLVKKYGKRNVVDLLNMDVYGNMITCLLGHNGAGKTTTLNMLLGVINRTSGKIKTNPPLSWGTWGYCPQHTMVISVLSVRNHLILFARLRGLMKKEAELEAAKCLELTKLTKFQHHACTRLSGGQQRNTCIAMALIGDTKILVLDEPTAGLDPKAKTRVWETLMKLRNTHTIFLTTHTMEEAEILADRIIIMHGGKVICNGTPGFLKQIYGVGYVLSVLGLPGFDARGQVLDFLKQYAPNAKLQRIFAQSATYSLEYLPSATLLAMLGDLGSHKEELKLQSHILSFMNLEEVFIKSGEEASGHSLTDEQDYVPDKVYNNKCCIVFEQFFALLLKRLMIWTGSIYSFLLLAVVIWGCSMIFYRFKKGIGRPTSYYKLSDFMDPIVYVAYDGNENNTNLAKDIVEVVRKDADVYLGKKDTVLNLMRSKLEKDIDLFLQRSVVSFIIQNNKDVLILDNPLASSSATLGVNILTSALYNDTIRTENGPNVISRIDSKDDWINLGCFTVTYHCFFLPYVLYLQLNETKLHFKRMQIMSGVPRLLYWFTTFIWDLLFALLIYGIYCGILHYKEIEYTNIGQKLLAFVLFNIAKLPLVYIFSYTNSLTVGYVVLMIEAICSVCLALIVFVLQHYPDRKDGAIKMKNFLSMIWPSYNHFWYELSEDENKKDMDFNYVIICFVFSILLYWTIFILTDAGYFTLCCIHTCELLPCQCKSNGMKRVLTIDLNNFRKIYISKKKRTQQLYPDSEEGSTTDIPPSPNRAGTSSPVDIEQSFLQTSDLDVKKEAAVVEYMSENNRMKLRPVTENSPDTVQFEQREFGVIPEILVKDINVVYRHGCCCNQMTHSVKNINLAIDKGICFGLLGVNGAGKSSLFKTIVGEHLQKSGRVYEFGRRRHMCNQCIMQMSMGYCPQENAVHSSLSACSLFFLFAMFKGVPLNKIRITKKKWLKLSDLERVACKASKGYSGGMKRRLCNALAMMGSPKILLMDEPTESVDPVGRRTIWNLIQSAKQCGITIVLTSHSMEECEALCDRLTIMLAGQMACIGDNTYLKIKYTKGYTMLITLKVTEDQASLDQSIKSKSPDDSLDISARSRHSQQSGHSGHSGRSEQSSFRDIQAKLLNQKLMKIKQKIELIKQDIEAEFSAELSQEQPTLLSYNVYRPDLTLSEVFNFCERLKTTHEIISEYQVGDTSLRQVFLSFATI